MEVPHELLENSHDPQDAPQRSIESLRRQLTKLSDLQDNAISARHLQFRTNKIYGLLDFFQEDPQLLDPHLASLLPPLISTYIKCTQSGQIKTQRKQHITSRADAISKVLCAFCKVRGRKVIARFLDNDPHLVELLLQVHDHLQLHQEDSNEDNEHFKGKDSPLSVHGSSREAWQQQYVVVLWLAHLALTPFDLLTLSREELFKGDLRGLACPKATPLIALQMLEVGIKSLASATSQRVVAADLLARLSLRPDMRKLGLCRKMIEWAVYKLEDEDEVIQSVHKSIGLLTFLSGIFASGALDSIGTPLQIAYSKITKLFETDIDSTQPLQDSAIAKCLHIKIRRNFVVQLLQHRRTSDTVTARITGSMLDSESALEDLIDLLLQSLMDRETQVRLAASKAISVVAAKLDEDMADEIVEVVIGSLNEDVFEEHGRKNYEAVNPLRWHGLAMTLSHLLFRRIPSATRLQDILNALYMTLTFAQKSPSGHSIGGNVRDAANFGLWSLARRYSTAELSAERLSNAITKTAQHLICSACFDPVGNVRRGSSAALQELVGRHPDTIENGIALIQIVDYQAVGLRSRAMESVSRKAASLSSSYRDSLIGGIYGWRGTSAQDQLSRETAARAIGTLTDLQSVEEHVKHFESCIALLRGTSSQDVEIWHGLLIALAEILDKLAHRLHTTADWVDSHCQEAQKSLTRQIQAFNENPTQYLGLAPSQIEHPRRQPDLIALGVVNLVKAFAIFLDNVSRRLSGTDPSHMWLEPELVSRQIDPKLLDLFSSALGMVPESNLELVHRACAQVLSTMTLNIPDENANKCTPQAIPIETLTVSWINMVKSGHKLARVPGIQIALGTAWCALNNIDLTNEIAKHVVLKDRILQTLAQNAQPPTDIEARVVAIRALRLLTTAHTKDISSCFGPLFKVLHLALNDYTVNERGDVGSLVRLEALKAMRDIWLSAEFNSSSPLAHECFLSVLSLSLGKLDKVRAEAVYTLQYADACCSWAYPRNHTPDLSTVSSSHHYVVMAAFLKSPSVYKFESREITQSQHAQNELLAVLEGFAISAGLAASTTLSVAREALASCMDELPAYPAIDSNGSGQLSVIEIANGLSTLISNNMSNERVLVPLLELVAFLLDFRVLQRLDHASPIEQSRETKSFNGPHQFKFRTLLSLVQKAHFKTSNIPKILAAVDIYSGLSEIEVIRDDVRTKLTNMLQHPFPRVRVQAAEVLWMITGDEDLKPRVWADPPSIHKGFVAEFKRKCVNI